MSVSLKDTLTLFRLVESQATHPSLEGWKSLRVLDIECPLIENEGDERIEGKRRIRDERLQINVIVLFHYITCALN